MSVDRVKSLSDIMGKQTSSLVVKNFDLCHVMTMAVEVNGQMCQLVTCFHRVLLHRKLKNNA